MNWSMPISDLLPYLDASLEHGDSDALVTEISISSAQCAPGSLFVAIPGTRVDAHRFIPELAMTGAAGAVVERVDPTWKLPPSFALLKVSDSRLALSALAALRYGHPANAFQMIGITGTNGKTTSNWIVYHLLNRLGIPALRIGTLGVGSECGIENPGSLTTPNALEVMELLATGRERGLRGCVMEVSSHALAQRRAEHLEFSVAAFTNLTRDHLDYHSSMEDYFQAKSHLFELLRSSSKGTRTAVISIDDPYGERLAAELRFAGEVRLWTFGMSKGADIRIDRFEENLSGSQFVIAFEGAFHEVRSRFIGRHNAYNVATAFGCVCALGIAPEAVIPQLSTIPEVPGRLERVHDDSPVVYVDYAHTPDALQHVLRCLRPLTPGRLIALFGCGGDRDGGKRPQMADIAAEYADVVVVTSDNPRTEDPHKIISDILTAPSATKIRTAGIIEVDRRKAIQAALSQAGPRDAVLIAGKGHEDYQIIGAMKHHFSDQEEVRKFFSV